MEHIIQKIVIGVYPEVVGKQPNAEERRKLSEVKVSEETFEEAGRLVSKREAIREPNHFSKKLLKAMIKEERSSICIHKFLTAMFELENAKNEEVVDKSKSRMKTYASKRKKVSNSKRTASKLARQQEKMFGKEYKLDVYNSWQNFENEEAVADELKEKGFETYYDVEARDLKGLKVGTVRVKSEEEISLVSKNTDFRSARQQINNEMAFRWGIYEK